jgi:hypothetical protein
MLGGNAGCNTIWEAQLPPPAAAAGGLSQPESAASAGSAQRVRHTDSWVWGDDDDAVSQSVAKKGGEIDMSVQLLQQDMSLIHKWSKQLCDSWVWGDDADDAVMGVDMMGRVMHQGQGRAEGCRYLGQNDAEDRQRP